MAGVGNGAPPTRVEIAYSCAQQDAADSSNATDNAPTPSGRFQDRCASPSRTPSIEKWLATVDLLGEGNSSLNKDISQQADRLLFKNILFREFLQRKTTAKRVMLLRLPDLSQHPD